MRTSSTHSSLSSHSSHPSDTNTDMSLSLAGKKIVVTGASRGIGADIVRALVAQGPAAVVIGYASSKSSADALIEAIQEKHGHGVALHAVGGAILDQASAHAFAKAALTALGGELDALVNNAGIMAMKPLAEMTQADYDDHFRECCNSCGLV
jgi:3-oxoacyl-[acyl-carrier protein] reductase